MHSYTQLHNFPLYVLPIVLVAMGKKFKEHMSIMSYTWVWESDYKIVGLVFCKMILLFVLKTYADLLSLLAVSKYLICLIEPSLSSMYMYSESYYRILLLNL